jgi:hypothetical protein
MIGSEKQIIWAEQIKADWIQEITYGFKNDYINRLKCVEKSLENWDGSKNTLRLDLEMEIETIESWIEILNPLIEKTTAGMDSKKEAKFFIENRSKSPWQQIREVFFKKVKENKANSQ